MGPGGGVPIVPTDVSSLVTDPTSTPAVGVDNPYWTQSTYDWQLVDEPLTDADFQEDVTLKYADIGNEDKDQDTLWCPGW